MKIAHWGGVQVAVIALSHEGPRPFAGKGDPWVLARSHPGIRAIASRPPVTRGQVATRGAAGVPAPAGAEALRPLASAPWPAQLSLCRPTSFPHIRLTLSRVAACPRVTGGREATESTPESVRARTHLGGFLRGAAPPLSGDPLWGWGGIKAQSAALPTPRGDRESHEGGHIGERDSAEKATPGILHVCGWRALYAGKITACGCPGRRHRSSRAHHARPAWG